jgi:glycyl-tRNA synthetase (class II)
MIISIVFKQSKLKSSGHFNQWHNGIVHQETRGIYYKGDKILSNALNQLFAVDPILFVIGICGLFYAL